MSTEFITILVALAIGAMFLIVGVEALHALRSKPIQPTNPNQQAVLDALTSWVYKAIIAGEKTINDATTAIDASLQGADKKAVADSIYALLPDSILVGGIPIPLSVIKSFVPKDVFEARIKDVYDEVHAFILKNQAWLADQVDALAPAAPISKLPADQTPQLPIGSVVQLGGSANVPAVDVPAPAGTIG